MPVPGSCAESGERRGLVPDLFPELAARVQELPPFFRDSEFILHLRTFYQNVQTEPGKFEEAWAGGGWLAYESGWQWDTFSVGATLYTSQPLYAPASREGTLLLGPEGQGFTVVGEAWAKLKYEDQVLTGYRQQVDLGYVNPYDGRMAPNTFEGVMLNGKLGGLAYAAGYLTQMKPRNADAFVSMSEAAGAGGTHQGAALAGFRLEPWKSLSVEANTVFAVDTFNTAFVEAQYTRPLATDVTLSLGLQYTDQRSVGNALLGSFQTWTVGARAKLDGFGLSVEPAFHRTGSGNNIQTPFGRWPGYLKMITKDFDLARQTALGVRLAYDFGWIGAPGVTGRFAFAGGIDAIDPKNGEATPDEREYDFDLIYAPVRGWLDGLSFHVRVGLVQRVGVSGLLPDIRLTMNYELPVLRRALMRRLRAWWEKD
jgi:outer membrane OprD family porin